MNILGDTKHRELLRRLDAVVALGQLRLDASRTADPYGASTLRPSALDWLTADELYRYDDILGQLVPYTQLEQNPELARERVRVKRAARVAAMHRTEARAILEALDVLDIPGVKYIVDTDALEDRDQRILGHAAVVGGDHLIAWHVTSDPARVIRIVRKKADLEQAYGAHGKTAELGAGLYLSAVPQLWTGRAMGKWAFLKALSSVDLLRLIEALRAELRSKRREHGGEYNMISPNEYERGIRDIGYVSNGTYDPDVLVFLAGQPYSIPFWRDDWLKNVGLRQPAAPASVEFHFRGRFAAVDTAGAWPGAVRALKRIRPLIHGAFLSGGYTDTGQIVIWDARSISSMGAPRQVAA